MVLTRFRDSTGEICVINHLVGVVVDASALRTADSGFDSRFFHRVFFLG